MLGNFASLRNIIAVVANFPLSIAIHAIIAA